MTRLRSPSLYWTFAGSFLVVLGLAIVLQGLVVVWVVRPAVHRGQEARAELAAGNAAERIGRLLAEGGPRSGVVLVLREWSRPETGVHLTYVDEDGASVPPRGGPGRRRRQAAAGDGGAPPRAELAARAPVIVDGVARGEVQARILRPRFGGWPRGVPGLVFLPLAVLVAGLAALVMFRLLVRRVRALEDLTHRVSAGDLDARVADPGRDEIGRLAGSLNTMTQRLADARDRLEANDRQRRQLFADITHELATPLTSLRGYAETLRNPALQLSGEERARYLDHMEEEAIRMAALLDDLLELTRLEAGVIPLEREPLDLAQLASNLLLRQRDRAPGLEWRGHGLERECRVTVDGRRLEQVLENLLANAARHAGSGRVDLHLESGPDAVELRVEDEGPGFPPDDLPHVFDRFYRAEAARSTDGTGLGLAIVRGIAEAHGGSVEARNRASGGASLVVRLPR